MAQVEFPLIIMRKFVQTLSKEIGPETLTAVLKKSGLPKDWARDEYFVALNLEQAASSYARLQSALRTYYGRGARGILLRIGAKLWNQLLDDSSFGIKTQASLIRSLPKFARRKQVLELLGKILSVKREDITVHMLDLDLLF